MIKSQFALLTKRRFLPLFVTQFLGAFNDNVFKNALVMLITYRLAEATGGNAQIMVTLAAGIFIFPFFLFSATAGQLADKYEKSALIFKVKFVEIVLTLLAALGFYLENVSLLMFALFLLGTQATFFGPLKYAILPEQLKADELIGGNGLVEAGTFLAILFGTIFGGLLVLVPRGELLISIAIITFAFCGLLSSSFIPKTKIINEDMTINYNFIVETFRVMRYAKERREIYMAIMAISWFWLVGATFLAEFPVFTKNSLAANQDVVTFFFTLFSIGIGLGSLFCNKLLKGEVNTKLVPTAAFGITLFTIDLFFAANHALKPAGGAIIGLHVFLQSLNSWRITFDILLIAVCGGIYTVPLYAVLQKRSDPAHRARVIASNNIVNALFMVGAAIATVLMLKYGFTVNQVFLTVAIVNAFVAIYISSLR
jgi:acyl-[acyl-carrier-protein]-phospholipid O-acyltransferase/long-chain-fatty-acid--[acyl-carrier-protein] ligase